MFIEIALRLIREGDALHIVQPVGATRKIQVVLDILLLARELVGLDDVGLGRNALSRKLQSQVDDVGEAGSGLRPGQRARRGWVTD